MNDAGNGRIAVKSLLTAAAAAGLFVAGQLTMPQAFLSPYQAARDLGGRTGEVLLHRLTLLSQEEDNNHLPLATITPALYYDHGGVAHASFWRQAAGAAAFLLIVALGCWTESLGAGLGAVATLLGVTQLVHGQPHLIAWPGNLEFLENFMSLVVLLAAGLCVWRARDPSPRRTFILALALGASLLERSTLVLFPLLLALWDCLRGRRRPLSLVILVIVPYLFLTPWIAMNWRVHRRFVPLESGEANPVLVGGALGIVFKGEVEQRWSTLETPAVREAEDHNRVLSWAIGETLAHPWRFAAGCARRLRHAVSLDWPLFLLALVGAARRRRDPAVQVLALLCAYYVAAHCCLALLNVYFEPLWPLLAVLAALAFSPTLAFARRASRSAALAILGAGLACLLLLCARAAYALGDYARAAQAPLQPLSVQLQDALARRPGEAWLWYELGRRKMADGDLAAASADLERAVALQPDRPEWGSALAWTRLLRGAPADYLAWAAAHPLPFDDHDDFLTRAYGAFLLGRAEEIGPLIQRALALPAEGGPAAHPPCADTVQLAAHADVLFSARPTIERTAFFKALARAFPLCEAFARAAATRRASSRLTADEKDTLRIALLDQENGRCDRALTALARLPQSAEILTDRAVCESLVGRKKDAVQDLKRAISIDRRWLPAFLTLGAIDEDVGRFKDAVGVYDLALRDASASDSLRPQVVADRAEAVSRLKAKSAPPVGAVTR